MIFWVNGRFTAKAVPKQSIVDVVTQVKTKKNPENSRTRVIVDFVYWILKWGMHECCSTYNLFYYNCLTFHGTRFMCCGELVHFRGKVSTVFYIYSFIWPMFLDTYLLVRARFVIVWYIILPSFFTNATRERFSWTFKNIVYTKKCNRMIACYFKLPAQFSISTKIPREVPVKFLRNAHIFLST